MALGIGSGAWEKGSQSRQKEWRLHSLPHSALIQKLSPPPPVLQTLPKSSPQTPRPTSVHCANIYKLSKPELVALTLLFLHPPHPLPSPFLYHQHPVNHNQFYSQTATQIHPHRPIPSALPLSSSPRFDH